MNIVQEQPTRARAADGTATRYVGRVNPGGSNAALAPANANRLALIVTYTGALAVADPLQFLILTETGAGMRTIGLIMAGQYSVVMTLRDYGPIVQYAFQGNDNGTGAQVDVWEVTQLREFA